MKDIRDTYESSSISVCKNGIDRKISVLITEHDIVLEDDMTTIILTKSDLVSLLEQFDSKD